MTYSSDLSIVIPTYNEEASIFGVLKDLIQSFPEAQIIVIDDGSSDRTFNLIQDAISQHPQIVGIRHRYNRGYGASLKSGMLKATRDYIAWFDSDGEMKTDDLLSMFREIRTNNLAAVIGRRDNFSPSTMTRRLGKMFIRMLAYLLNIKGSYDLNCGLRIFRTDVITRYLSILPNRFSASMTSTILLLERDYPIRFHRVSMKPRTGMSTLRLHDGFQAAVKVLQLITLFAPIRLYFVPGLTLLAIGVVYGTWVTISEGYGFPVAGILTALSGFMCCVLGLIADHVSHLRLDDKDIGAETIDINPISRETN